MMSIRKMTCRLESGLRLVSSVLPTMLVTGQEGGVRWQQYKAFPGGKTAAGCGEHIGGLQPLPAVNEGDIIFHASRSAQSQAVQQATGQALRARDASAPPERMASKNSALLLVARTLSSRNSIASTSSMP